MNRPPNLARSWPVLLPALAITFLLLSGFAGLSIAVFSLVLYGSTRFRLPLEPFAILFAAAFLAAGERRWGRRRIALAAGLLFGANLLLYWQDQALRTLILSVLNDWGLR